LKGIVPPGKNSKLSRKGYRLDTLKMSNTAWVVILNQRPFGQAWPKSSARTGLFVALQGGPEAAISEALISLCLNLKGCILAGQAAGPCLHDCAANVERLPGCDDGG